MSSPSPSSTTSPPPAAARRYTDWVARNPVAILVSGFLIFALGVWLTLRLELRTAFHELLPQNDPGVVALMKTQQRMGFLTLLTIGLKSPDKQANIDFAEQLTVGLRKLPKEVSEYAAYHMRDLRDFFERNKWLYLPEEDLEAIRDRLRREIGKAKNPLQLDLSDDSETDDLETRLKNRRNALADRFPGGYFSSNDGQYLWIMALPPGGIFAERGGEPLYRAAHALVKELQPKFPGVSAEVTGPIVTAIRSRQAVERDVLWVTMTCLVLVALAIGIYFRRLRAVPLIGAPACLGTILAFAVAQLTFGHLNASTAFLGSIILGNGINYGIILMARYEERIATGEAYLDALAGSIGDVFNGTLIAAVCASTAYLSLVLTSFRGFSQFGVMGAVGVLFCWLANFTMLPAMLVILDRRFRKTTHRAPLGLGFVSKLLVRAPRAVLAGSVLVTVVAIVGAAHFLDTPFEYDFRKLNTDLNSNEQTKSFNKNLDGLFGRWPYPTLVLADDRAEVELVRQSIRRQDATRGKVASVGQIITMDDALPGTAPVQERKIELVKQIRKMVDDPDLQALDDKERERIGKIDPPVDPRVVQPGDLPWLARRPFTEVDGTMGRVLLVYPPEKGFSMWNGHHLLEMADVIQHIELPGAEGTGTKAIDTAGSAVVFGAMLRSILRDGPIATVASLLAVMLIVLLVVRPVRLALATMASLLVGVLWMLGAAGWGGVLITFLNFIALPITFGIGAEYAVNVMSRYRQTNDIAGAVASTGGAVALCSFTTIVGYGSLLAARNHALQGFGLMAVLGEVACLTAAVIALPAAILSFRKA